MDKWQQEFSSKLNALREGWSNQFEEIASEMLDRVFADYSDFVRRCDLQPTAMPEHKGMRHFKFALSEDAFVMLYFRPRGVDQIESDYECFLPRVGKVCGVKSITPARSAERKWAEGCFRMALDDLVMRYSESSHVTSDAELVLT